MQASDIRWASRWDTYLLMMDDQIHWFSIINSVSALWHLQGTCQAAVGAVNTT
jgi:transmembrane 9 superfamily protein 2/4